MSRNRGVGGIKGENISPSEYFVVDLWSSNVYCKRHLAKTQHTRGNLSAREQRYFPCTYSRQCFNAVDVSPYHRGQKCLP